MNRIDTTFAKLKQEQKTAFIGFLTAGDPDMDTCMECVRELEKNGCDIIEIGIPFSDPIAEGPVIQEASLRALKIISRRPMLCTWCRRFASSPRFRLFSSYITTRYSNTELNAF